jgi:hypothetical protein
MRCSEAKTILGDELFELMTTHGCEEWDFSALNDHDLRRAYAIGAFTVATRQRLRPLDSDPPLNLQLANRCPRICQLVYPMLIKIPVVSLRWFLEIHVEFAFNEIRKSTHPASDDIIAYLYELLFLQQKITIALSVYIRLAAQTADEKQESALIKAEIDAILGADLIFSYLKASIEKTIALVGMKHGIMNLDAKKTHRAKLDALNKGLPAIVRGTPYFQFVMEFVKSENLDELNNYRSGLLHKRGIADLQPHNDVGVDAHSLPFRKIYAVLHEQHAKNSAVLLASLALLTDELVRRHASAQHVSG